MDVRKILAQAHFEKVQAERTFGLMRAGWVEAGQRAEEQVVADAIAAEVTRAVAEEREAAARVAESFDPEADARLIAAAPDLLAALERAEALLSVPDNGACVCRWCHADRLEPHAEHCWFDERRRAVLAAQDAARAAIAKARGTR